MKTLASISLLLCLCKTTLAQEVLKDTLVGGKLFHVIIRDDETNHAICVGNYVPHTYIRNGEWDYFFADGKLYSQSFFKLDDKTGIWIYYNEQGNITREMKPCKKHHPFIDYYANPADDDAIMSVYYQNAQQNPHACILYSHGSAPLEYDEKLYQFKVNMMIKNMGRMRGDNTYIYKNIPIKNRAKLAETKHHHKHKKYERYQEQTPVPKSRPGQTS